MLNNLEVLHRVDLPEGFMGSERVRVTALDDAGRSFPFLTAAGLIKGRIGVAAELFLSVFHPYVGALLSCSRGMKSR